MVTHRAPGTGLDQPARHQELVVPEGTTVGVIVGDGAGALRRPMAVAVANAGIFERYIQSFYHLEDVKSSSAWL